LKDRNSVVQKFDIINFLLRKYQFESYIEFCTPTSGRAYKFINRSQLKRSHRLMYRCPAEFDDGYPIDFRSESEETYDCMDKIYRSKLDYDLAFVDPSHTYHCSFRDLFCAFSVLGPRGIIVVHDCHPPDEAHVHSEFQEGFWCGETYGAYIDFVNSLKNIEFYTVDTDYGCGVIKKNIPSIRSPLSRPQNIPERMLSDWHDTKTTASLRYRFFKHNKSELLNLMSVAEFVALEALEY
jgi:hypothetical protein